MSHSTNGKTAVFLHNGDYSGNVRIVMPRSEAKAFETGGSDGSFVHVEVPFDDIEMFVLEKIRQETLGELEDIDLSTPRGRWKLFTLMSAIEGDTGTPHGRGFETLRGR